MTTYNVTIDDVQITVTKDSDGRFIVPNEVIDLVTKGSAVKPAHEPILLARKPLVGRLIDNVLQFGTGALNIDACRVEYVSDADRATAQTNALGPVERGITSHAIYEGGKQSAGFADTHSELGRWPANLIGNYILDSLA